MKPTYPYLILITSLLAGCGNFIESLDIGKWEEVGEDRLECMPPHAPRARPRSDVSLTLQHLGSEATIRVGDLVQLKITVKKTYRDQSTKTLPPKTLWLWTGDIAGNDKGGHPWGWLGDTYLRENLIGVPVGSRLKVAPSLEDRKLSGSVSVPQYGFVVSKNLTPFLRNYDDYEISNRSDWGSSAFVESDIEVLNACKGRLFHRTTTIRQWGLLIGPGMGGPVRAGQLYSSALKGECPAPIGDVWLTTGPNKGAGMIGGYLYNAFDTFRRQHPESRYPEDYWRSGDTAPPIPAKNFAPQLARNCPEDTKAKESRIEDLICAGNQNVLQEQVNRDLLDSMFSWRVADGQLAMLNAREVLAALNHKDQAELLTRLNERSLLLHILGKPPDPEETLRKALVTESLQTESLDSLREKVLSKAIAINFPTGEFAGTVMDARNVKQGDFPIIGGDWTTKLSTDGSYVYAPVQIEYAGGVGRVMGILADLRITPPAGENRDPLRLRIDTWFSDTDTEVTGPGQRFWVRAWTGKKQTRTFSKQPDPSTPEGAELYRQGVGYSDNKKIWWVNIELTGEDFNQVMRQLMAKKYRLEFEVLRLDVQPAIDDKHPYLSIFPDSSYWVDRFKAIAKPENVCLTQEARARGIR